MVDIFIPVHNGFKYLNEAIESIKAQTYRSWKLTLVDDGSTDGSSEICKSYALEDDRISFKIYPDPDPGAAKNWNRCLSMASAKYSLIFHQDDVMKVTFLEKVVTFMEDYPEAVWVSTRVNHINGSGKYIYVNGEKSIKPKTFDHWNFEEDAIFNGLEVEKLILRRVFFNASTCFIRTKSTRSIAPFREDMRLMFDAEYFARLSSLGEVGYLAEELVYYRWHENSGMSNTYPKGLNGIETKWMIDDYRNRNPGLMVDELYSSHAYSALRLAKKYLHVDKKVANLQVDISLWFAKRSNLDGDLILSKWISYRFFKGKLVSIIMKLIPVLKLLKLIHNKPQLFL